MFSLRPMRFGVKGRKTAFLLVPALIVPIKGQRMILLALIVIPAAAIACIPVKPVDPGIPADTAVCPVLDALNLDTCNKLHMKPVGPCSEATQTTQSLTCTKGRLIIIGSLYPAKPYILQSSARCDRTSNSWIFSNYGSSVDLTQAHIYADIGAPIKVACVSETI